MLPPSHRLRRSDDFRRAVRSGRRAGRRAVVVHLLDGHSVDGHSPSGSGVVAGTPDDAARVGFVVSKAVGNAVVRNRVHRRLRAVMATRLPDLPAGSLTVVRAQPAAATASYAELVVDVDGALRRVLVDSR